MEKSAQVVLKLHLEIVELFGELRLHGFCRLVLLEQVPWISPPVSGASMPRILADGRLLERGLALFPEPGLEEGNVTDLGLDEVVNDHR